MTDLTETNPEHRRGEVSIDRLPMATLVLDSSLRVLAVNRGWEQLSGRSAHDSRGMFWLQPIDPRDRDDLRVALTSSSGAGTSDHRLIGPDGSRWARWWWQREGDRTHICIADVDEDRRRERDLLLRATHDPLTGLANRSEFLAVLHRALEREVGAEGLLAVVYLDLDEFKDVNDSAGHSAGDHLLAIVAEAVVGAIRPFDLAGRLGGDEFAVVCPGLSSAEEAHELADRITAAIAACTAAAGTPITATAGVATNVAGETRPDTVLIRADRAMYQAKKSRRRPADACAPASVATWTPSPDVATLEQPLATVLVPMLFRTALSLHAAAELTDERTASAIGHVIAVLDDVIGTLRHAVLAERRQELRAPSLDDAHRSLCASISLADRAVGLAWAGASAARPVDEMQVERLVQSMRGLRTAARSLDPRMLG